MNPSFSSYLVNDVFGDPGVYVDIRWSKRALLFDLGDIAALPERVEARAEFIGLDRHVAERRRSSR